MGSVPSVLSRSERQDELVKMLPEGCAKVIRRPKTNPDGSDIVTFSDFEFPVESCHSLVEELLKVMRSSPERNVMLHRDQIKEYCGIESSLGPGRLQDRQAKKGSTSYPEFQ